MRIPEDVDRGIILLTWDAGAKASVIFFFSKSLIIIQKSRDLGRITSIFWSLKTLKRSGFDSFRNCCPFESPLVYKALVQDVKTSLQRKDVHCTREETNNLAARRCAVSKALLEEGACRKNRLSRIERNLKLKYYFIWQSDETDIALAITTLTPIKPFSFGEPLEQDEWRTLHLKTELNDAWDDYNLPFRPRNIYFLAFGKLFLLRKLLLRKFRIFEK